MSRVIEAPTMDKSASSVWWLSSGAYFYERDPAGGATIQGDLPEGDSWRDHYAKSNPRDTANGRRPQCLFRLVRREKAQDPVVSFRFRIKWVNKDIDSPERAAWSGVLAFLRYQDSQNLYYAGIRHDGELTIKRKRAGKYTTLAQRKVFAGTYDREAEKPNLIPDGWHNLSAWIGGQEITVLIDAMAALTVRDGAAEAITVAGHSGIRTDFSDVEFEAIEMTEDFQEPAPPPAPKTIEERVAALEAWRAALEKGTA